MLASLGTGLNTPELFSNVPLIRINLMQAAADIHHYVALQCHCYEHTSTDIS